MVANLYQAQTIVLLQIAPAVVLPVVIYAGLKTVVDIRSNVLQVVDIVLTVALILRAVEGEVEVVPVATVRSLVLILTTVEAYAGVRNVQSTRGNVLQAVSIVVVLGLIRQNVVGAVLEQIYKQVVQAVRAGHLVTVVETVNKHAGMDR